MYEDEIKVVEARLQPIFDRRGGYKPEAAHKVATFLVLAASYGAGDALAGSLLMKLPVSTARIVWRALTGNFEAELPCRLGSCENSFCLLDQRTGDREVDLVLMELEHGARCGSNTFGTERAKQWAEEQVSKRYAQA